MNLLRLVLAISVIPGVVLTAGCSTTLPSMAHVHVGHALTGWMNTPEQKGLFVTAEEYADRIATTSISASDGANEDNFRALRISGLDILNLIGARETVFEAEQYTFLSAFEETRSHLGFSLESEDASANLRSGMAGFLANSETILARTEALVAKAEALADETDWQTAETVAREIRELAVQNLEGEDINNNGVIGDSAEEYGLRQLRDDLSAVLNRELPPYAAIEQRYLFGIVRLPDGTWEFTNSNSGATYGRYAY